METDHQLAVFCNMMGMLLFFTILLYHWINVNWSRIYFYIIYYLDNKKRKNNKLWANSWWSVLFICIIIMYVKIRFMATHN